MDFTETIKRQIGVSVNNLTGETSINTGESMKGAEMQMMSLNEIKLGRNSRLIMKTEDLSGLMESIKQVGLLQPIGVSKDKNGYTICYGNRRYLACHKLGLKKIPVIVHQHKNAAEEDLKNLTENLQRRNISLMEAGRYVNLLIKAKLSTAEIASRLGVSKSYVNQTLTAYNDVPDKFKGDIEVSVSKGSKRSRSSTGKIAVSSAQRIISAQKTYQLTNSQTEYLFEQAKTSDKFSPDKVSTYAKKLANGVTNPVEKEERAKHLTFGVMISETEYHRLWKKYVLDGKLGWKGLTPLVKAILSGEVHERIRILKVND